MNDIVILHLSDLHIEATNRNYSKLLRGLLEDIKKEIVNIPDNRLVIAVTGDIIHQGKKEACNNALKFFEDLYKIVKEKAIGIYIVPGNHDKFRSEDNKILISGYRKNNSEKIASYDNTFYEKFWNFHLNAYDDSEGGSGYLDLTRKIYSIFGIEYDKLPERNYIDDTFGVDVIELDNKKYCFVMLNTAWSSIDDDDNRKLFLGDFQIEEINRQFSKIGDDAELTFVLGHHPIESLIGEEQDKVFAEMIAYEGLGANVYLCGHTHDRRVINWGNNTHSMNTLMTGIGWPEKTSATHIGDHTYSMYVFNVNANSIDAYVRSTDDGGQFVPDFKIYTNKIDQNAKKIVLPIKSQKAKTYISLGTGPNRSPKAYYISEEFLEYIKEYVLRIGKIRQSIGILIESQKSDLFESLSESSLDSLQEKYNAENVNKLTEQDSEPDGTFLNEILYNYLFMDVAVSDDEKYQEYRELQEDIEGIVDYIFDEYEDIRFQMFLSFLQRICEKMEVILLHDKIEEGDIVRFHFRSLANLRSRIYIKLCASFLKEKHSIEDHELSDIKYGELIEAAFKTKKALIYTVNEDLCKNKLKEKWTNFLTIVPVFDGNNYERKYGEGITEEFPYITFGVTTNSEKFDELLYCMDYFSINEMLEDIINSYIKIFKINIGKFCDWYKKIERE